MKLYYAIFAGVLWIAAIGALFTAPENKTAFWGFLVMSVIASTASTIFSRLDRLEEAVKR